jgi:hypothetical protein
MYVGQSVILSKWFLNFEISFAMALSGTIPLIASFIGGAVFPAAYSSTDSFGYTLLLGFWACLFSLICVVFLALLDNKTEANDKEVLKEYIQN